MKKPHNLDWVKERTEIDMTQLMDLIRKNTSRTPEIDDKLKKYPLQLTPGIDIHRELSTVCFEG